MSEQQRYFGPDRNTRPARFKPPAGSCDCHAHLYGPAAQFPYPAGTNSAGLPDAGLDDYMKMHEVLGIERGILVQSSNYGTDNSAVLDGLRRYPKVLRGIIKVPPAELTAEKVKQLDDAGVRGIRVHRGEHPLLEEISERIAGAGWRVELVPPNIESIVALRPRLEKLKCHVLVDQIGRPDVTKGLDDPSFRSIVEMLEAGTIWVKVSHAPTNSKLGPPYTDILPFAQRAVAANAARCVWGSDWPHGVTKYPTPNDGMLLDVLADWVPDEATRNRILVDNPNTLNRF